MNDNKIIIGVILATVTLLFGGIWIAQKNNTPVEVTVNQDAHVATDQNSYDWGTIQLSGGIVTKTFTINNTGSQSLQIRNINTSCMCTNAKVTIDGQPSPLFGMHQKSNWVGEVPSGGKAELEVTFDPAYHGPSGVGTITRQVTVETSDANNPKLMFNLTAQVVNSDN